MFGGNAIRLLETQILLNSCTFGLSLSLQHVAASAGSGAADLEKLCAILEAVPALKYICLDVANGYSEHFVEFVKMVREKFPKHTIMVRKLSLAATALAPHQRPWLTGAICLCRPATW